MAPSRDRKAQLITVSATYFEALARKNFDAVPWTNSVVFRGPLAPGGAETPLIGREAVLAFFNAIGPNLGEVRIVGHFFNEDLTAIMTKAEVGVVQPPCVLRVADLFEVDAEGRITSQENHYDPRPAMVTPSTET
ncbi:MAG: nuclear transport factor 2 family protein [Acidobacteria bacterium]|nr:nuclear transport factor 2 family protein [Acidobacteriota bacterium]